MQRTLAVAILAIATRAEAEPLQVGAFAGPRMFSDDSRLGFVETSRGHPSLNGSVSFGARIALAIRPWLLPELELGFARTDTTPEDGKPSVDVTWFEPRLHVRIEPFPRARVRPFAVVGGGLPAVFAPADYTMQSGITGEGYFGLGVRVPTGPVVVRFDARVIAHPGIEFYVTREFEAGLGIELAIGGGRKRSAEKPRIVAGPDSDRDGVPDATDKCPERAEDRDGFEDADGCPDIDNDIDHVLDVSDRCPLQPETYNGYLDDDGCVDELPVDLAGVRGPITGLLFPERGTEVNDSALTRITELVTTLAAYPAVRIVLVGHTDKLETRPDPPGENDDLEALAEATSKARAEAVKQALVTAGMAADRIVVEGAGFEAPIAGNDTPRDRLTNRRVELKLWVPNR